mgnify:CR=1 FL=1
MDIMGNFINTSFIITLGLLIIISGISMLYFYRRLNLLENSIIEHGKILQNFIINYNNNILRNQFANSNKVNNETNINNNEIFEKINVSEDEDDHEDEDKDKDKGDNNIVSNSDSDSDSDSDADSNFDSDSESIKYINDEKNNQHNDDGELFIENLPITINKLNNEESKLINIIENNETNNETNNEKKNYSKMKVDDLRSLVVAKNLTNNDNALKLKKSELIEMIKQ